MPEGTIKTTGLEMPAGFACPDWALPEELHALLAEEDEKATKRAKKKSSKKKKAGAGGAAAEEEN